jgi:hypothetical protein
MKAHKNKILILLIGILLLTVLIYHAFHNYMLPEFFINFSNQLLC